MSLQPPDLHHLRAAQGWLDLGNPLEAAGEVARIAPRLLDHPDVLEVRWGVEAGRRDWDAALDVAQRLKKAAPDRASAWLHLSYAQRRARGGSVQAAWDILRLAFELFPKEPVIPFNLACYAAQSSRLDEAWDWLQKAMAAAGNAGAIKEMALHDPDLEPLWERIREL
jgi:Flp pilus assembly protein TadD